MPKLIITETGKSEERIVEFGAEVTIGRNPNNEVFLENPSISREHAKILKEGEQYYLIDLGSGNGTLLNGILLTSNEKNLLRNNDRITIQKYRLRLLESEGPSKKEAEEEEVTDPDILEVKLLKKILDAVDQDTFPSFEILNGTAQGKRFFLTEEQEEWVLGREPSCDFVIDEHVISRRHAKIAKKWAGLALVDLESKNGSYINNRRVTEEFLHDGDRIALGTIVLLFRNPKEINVQEIKEEMVSQKEALKPPPSSTPPLKEELPSEEESQATDSQSRSTEELIKDIPGFQTAPANIYPIPKRYEKRLSPLEIGMIGLGLAVFCFALITLVNLILE